jgi:Second Messenger Oligonucleotide or Dinucleotide Synthetase domain
MELKTDFDSFVSEIRPTANQQSDLQTGHQTLRDRLRKDDNISNAFVSDFLQGSYRRATAVRPVSDRRSDVDIIVVTRLSEQEYTPAKAMDLFKPFLDKHYKGKWRQQGRSFGIELSYVEMDLVLTAAPSETQVGILKSAAVTVDEDIELARDWRLNSSWIGLSERGRSDVRKALLEAAAQPEWKSQPLRIPDRDANVWASTHPLEQIRWTRDKNANCSRHFLNVVKALKWWRLTNFEKPEHPKGFPLERLIGECCPNGVDSIAEGVTRTLENIVSNYGIHARSETTPTLSDYGVPTHNVLKRVSGPDFKAFYTQATSAAQLARRALDSTDRTESGNLWRDLLGTKFPAPPNDEGGPKRGFTPPKAAAVPGSGRFA